MQQITTGAGVCQQEFTLSAKGSSCILTLQINGNAIKTPIITGPVVCDHFSPLQCYQPSKENSLNITATTKPTVQYAYIANFLATTISRCVVLNTGILSDCQEFDTSLTGALGIAIKNKVLYSARFKNKFLTQCQLMDNGAIGTCDSTPEIISSGIDPISFDIAFHPQGKWAYVSILPEGIINKCSIDASTGLLSSCAITPTPPMNINLFGIALMTKNGTTSAYFSTNEPSQPIVKCTLDLNGDFMGCTSAMANIPSFLEGSGIALNPSKNRIYIADPNQNTMIQCLIDANGYLQNCSSGAVGMFNSPIFIGLNANQSAAYVTNLGGNTVSKCDLDETGDLIYPCSTAVSIQAPSGIQLITL